MSEPGAEQGHGGATAHGGGIDFERLVFFSDAVIAIAMTLLVIDLRLPEWIEQTASDTDLVAAIGELAQPLLAAGLSFVVIALWWLSHHRLFRTLRAADSVIVALDIVFLASIVFLPFPTSVIGRFINLPTAVALYAFTNVVAGGSLLAMRLRAGSAGLLVEGFAAERQRTRVAIATLGPAVFALSIPIAFVSPLAGALTWNLLWIGGLAIRVAGRGR